MPRYESPYDPSSSPEGLEHLLYEKKGHVAYVTINRPAVRNAVDRPTAAALADAFRQFDADDSASAAVLYGGFVGAAVFMLLRDTLSAFNPIYWYFWIGLVLVVIVLVGRERMHRWALYLPNLVMRRFGAKAPTATVAAVERRQGPDILSRLVARLRASGGHFKRGDACI